MRTARVYIPQPLSSGAQIVLDETTSHYVVRVLRLRSGQPLVLFNGDGDEYDARVERAVGTGVVANIGAGRSGNRESPLGIFLGQSVARGERMDFVLQKSVELGVTSITPLRTRRTQVQLSGSRLDNRLAHWGGVVRSACEQSGRTVLPKLDRVALLSDWLQSAQCRNAQLRLVLDPRASVRLTDLEPAASVAVLVGPEGGLTEEEVSESTARGFVRLRLGPRTLRTETAPLALLAALQTLWGDLSGRSS